MGFVSRWCTDSFERLPHLAVGRGSVDTHDRSSMLYRGCDPFRFACVLEEREYLEVQSHMKSLHGRKYSQKYSLSVRLKRTRWTSHLTS